MPEETAFIWYIKSFPGIFPMYLRSNKFIGGKEYLMRAHFNLPSVMSEEVEGKRPVKVKFEIPYFTTSGIQVIRPPLHSNNSILGPLLKNHREIRLSSATLGPLHYSEWRLSNSYDLTWSTPYYRLFVLLNYFFKTCYTLFRALYCKPAMNFLFTMISIWSIVVLHFRISVVSIEISTFFKFMGICFYLIEFSIKFTSDLQQFLSFFHTKFYSIWLTFRYDRTVRLRSPMGITTHETS